MSPAPTTRRVQPTWPILAILILTAGIIAGVLARLVLSDSLALLGLPDPGVLTTFGYPFVRTAVWMLMAVTVGSYLASAFLLPAKKDSVSAAPYMQQARLSVDGIIAAQTGAIAAGCVCVLSLLLIPLTLSDVSGQSLGQSMTPANWAYALERVEEARAWLWTALLALPLACVGGLLRRWKLQPVAFGWALLLMLPLGLSGHSASGGDHDYGTNSLLWHLLAMQLWIGGLYALVTYARRLGPDLPTAVGRYSKIALAAIVTLAISGTVNAAIRVQPGDLLTTEYGRLLVAKFVLTIILAVCGYIQRARVLPQLSANPANSRLFRRLSVGELGWMAAVIGVAVALGRTPPPPPRYDELTPMMLEMGYSLTKEPTYGSVWTVWRFDLMFGTVGLLLTAAYVWGLVRLRQQGKSWPWHRTMWFFLGSLGLTIAMSSGIGMYMPATFAMHMVAHMVLSMVIPVFIVLGAPLRLALEAWQPSAEGDAGPREWLEAAIYSRGLRILMHPAVNTVQFVAIFYLLYITPWYEDSVSTHAGHLIMNWVFLLSGLLYFWEMIGPDPKPTDSTVLQRLAWLIFSMPFHLYFGVYLMQLTTVLAEDFYLGLQLPWEIDLLHDQRVGGGIAWASGAFPLTIVFGALFIEWMRTDKKEERAYEKKAAADDEAELASYNAMLAQYQQGHNPMLEGYHQEDTDDNDRSPR
ncbi:MAG: cytochrome c oxidase assembly protein [Corynebacterium sp.]|nr:cytochrome c oxidase assembly protein [Corynebacterium sp.]